MKVAVNKKDVIWSYLGYFFTLFTNLLILPFVMKKVNPNELGLWYTFLSISQFALIFDNTFTGCISRSFTLAWSGVDELKPEGVGELRNGNEVNYKLFITVIKTSHWIYGVVSAAVLVIVGTIGTLYLRNIADGIKPAVWMLAWIMFVFAIVANLYYSYWITALKGIGDFSHAQKANVFSKILQIVISLMGLYMGLGLSALAFAYLLSGFTLRLYGKACLMQRKDIRESYDRFYNIIKQKEVSDNFKKMWFNAKKSAIVCLSTYLITQSTTLICSAFLGLEETASYGLSLQIISAVAGVAMIYFNTMKPKLIEYKLHVGTSEEIFVKKMCSTVVAYWLTYMVALTAILWIGLPLVRLLKSDTELPFQMVLFMGIYLFLENNHSIFASIIEMSNKIPYVKASFITAIVIVVGEILSARLLHWGIYGLMGVQCLAQLCYNNWKWPKYVMKENELSLIDVLKYGVPELIGDIKKIIWK